MALNLRTILYASPFFLIGLAAIVAAVRLQQVKDLIGIRWVFTLLAGSTVYALAQSVEYISASLTAKVFWDNVQWIGIIMIPPAFLLLTMELSGPERWVRPLSILTLLVIPALTLPVFYTNHLHHFMVSSYTLIEHAGFTGMVKEFSYGFIIFMVYNCALSLWGISRLIWLAIRSPGYYRNQIRLPILAAVISITTAIIDTTSLDLVPYFQPTALALSGFSLVAALSLSRWRTQDIRTASEDLLFETISSPFFLFSAGTNLIELNSAAENLIGRKADEVIGKPLRTAAPYLYEQISHLLKEKETPARTMVSWPGSSLSFHAELSSNWDTLGRLHSYALLLTPEGETNDLLMDLQRSLSLVQSLSNVSALVAASSTPVKVFEIMREELRKLSLEFVFLTIDPLDDIARVHYASFNTRLLQSLEKLGEKPFIGLTLPRPVWPPIADELDSQYPVYVSDFSDAIRPTFAKLPDPVFQSAMALIGVTDKMGGIFIPISFSDGAPSVIVVWGVALQPQDVPAFSIFGSQVSSIIERAMLLEMEQERLQESRRANALMHALTRVATQAATSVDAGDVLEILAQELRMLNLDFYLTVVNPAREHAEIQFVSPGPRALRQVERLFEDRVIGARMKPQQWPLQAVNALERGEALFVRDFAADVFRIFTGYPDWMGRRGLTLVGIDEKTSGIHVPQELKDGSTAVLSIWGKDIEESDLPTFSVFASQVAVAYENARLYQSQQQKTRELARSNALLNMLSRITAQVSLITDQQVLFDAMKKELQTLNLGFVYILVEPQKKQSTIKHISIGEELIGKIERIAKIKLPGWSVPVKHWPEGAVESSQTKQPMFYPDYLKYLLTILGGPGRGKIVKQVLKLGGVTEDTRAIFLPISHGDDTITYINIWGDSLEEKDLAAFQVYAAQLESVLEISRLFHLAEEEIAERKSAQEALYNSREEYRRSEEQYRAVVEDLPGLISRYDLDFNITFVNKAYCDFFGTAPEEILGRSLVDLITLMEPEHFSQSMGQITSLTPENPIRTHEHHVTDAYGEKRWVRWIDRLLLDKYGNPMEYQCSGVDLTDRKLAEAALEEQHRFLRQVIDANPNVIFVRDSQGRYVLTNRKAAELYRARPGEVVGETREHRSIDEDLVAKLLEQDRIVMDSGQPLFIAEEEITLVSGEKRWEQVHKLPLFSPDGNADRVLVIIIDITERKKLQQAMLEAEKLASLGTLAAGIAHEINSPLQVITGRSESLQRRLERGQFDQGDFEKGLNAINHSGWRVAQIIRSLLGYAHPLAGESGPADLNELVKDTLLLIEHQLQTWSNITVETDLAADLPLLHCCGDEISRLLINLMTNARDAMPDGGTLTIRTRHSPDAREVLLEVVDSGEGIPEELLPKLYDPFFTTKPVGKGTGLGLFIVHGIVHSHGGQIDVCSEVGEGTTFSIHLPLNSRPMQPESAGRY